MNTRTFELAFGSVAGARHAALGRNNQDAGVFRRLGEDGFVAAVADGCSAGRHSEFGARLGIQSLGAAVASQTALAPAAPDFWEAVRERVLGDLAHALKPFEDPAAALEEFFLFTLAGCLVTDDLAVFFHLGDGCFAVNGEWIALPAQPGNCPAYCAYALQNEAPFPDEMLQFRLAKVLPVADLESAVIGTDGAAFLQEADGHFFPGRNECAGPLAELWTEDRFFRNPHVLQRYLQRLNPLPPPWRTGLLKDDTTLYVMRRRKEAA